VVFRSMVKDCPTRMEEHVLPASLIGFEMHGFDVILGMD
jgi:hypothetical protein